MFLSSWSPGWQINTERAARTSGEFGCGFWVSRRLADVIWSPAGLRFFQLMSKKSLINHIWLCRGGQPVSWLPACDVLNVRRPTETSWSSLWSGCWCIRANGLIKQIGFIVEARHNLCFLTNTRRRTAISRLRVPLKSVTSRRRRRERCLPLLKSFRMISWPLLQVQ